MAEDNQNEITYLCRYIITSLVFMLKDEKLEIDPSNVAMIEYMNDYDVNIHPLLKIQLRLDVRKKMWILKNKRDIVCKFEMSCVAMDSEATDNISTPQKVWNEEFSLFFNEEDENIDVSLLKERLALNTDGETVDQIDTENYYESQHYLDVYLFNAKLLRQSNTIYNEIMHEDTLQQFICRMLNKTEHDKVLMSEIENDEVYKELVIPPLKLYQALGYLDYYFGLYKSGAIIYYGIDNLYILNANGKVTAERKKEWTQTTCVVREVEMSTPGNGMIIKEDEDIYYLLFPEESVHAEKNSNINNASHGSDIVEIITDEIEKEEEEADQDYIDERNKILFYKHDDFNKYALDQLKTRLEENDLSLILNGDNYDIRAFRPNHEFNIVFDNETKQQKYGKFKYRISYEYHKFVYDGVESMACRSRVLMKKVPEEK